MEGVIRKDDTPQHKAVREAFTNMIIHADFMLDGLLRVVKYDNRFEFTNPGLLKLPLERIYAGGESKARNQRMQALLRMIGFGEGLGSGFPLILNAWKEKHWMRPELIEEPDLLQVKLILHVENKDENGTYGTVNGSYDTVNGSYDTVNGSYDTKSGSYGTVNGSYDTVNGSYDTVNGSYDAIKNLTKKQCDILKFIVDNPHISAEEISSITNIPQRTIYRDLKVLRDLDIVSRKGRKKDGIWVVNLNNDNRK